MCVRTEKSSAFSERFILWDLNFQIVHEIIIIYFDLFSFKLQSLYPDFLRKIRTKTMFLATKDCNIFKYILIVTQISYR